MCRMIAASGLVSIDFMIDSLRFMAQKGHVDGWGAVFRSNGYLFADRSVCSCLEDSGLDKYRGSFSDIAVFHARKARTGADIEMTHPFKLKSFLVFYNARFSNGQYDPLRLARHLEEHMGSDDASFASALAMLDGFYGANCVLVSPDRVLVGVRYKKPGYYQMHLSVDKKGVLVSSEPFAGREWRPVEDRSLISLYPDGSHERINF